MSKQVTQQSIDAAYKAVKTIKKETELAVLNQHGAGTLLLRLRPIKRGVSGTWTIRFMDDKGERSTVPLGGYDPRGEEGLNRTTACAEFNAWVIKRRDGVMLVKPASKPMAAYLTTEQAEPILPSETVAAMFKVFIEEYCVKENTPGTVAARQQQFAVHCQAIAGMRAKDLRARHVYELVLQPLVDAGKKSTADLIRSTLRSMYSIATQVTNGSTDHRFPAKLGTFGVDIDPLVSMKEIKGAFKPRKRPMPINMLRPIYQELGVTLTGDLGRLALLLGGTRFQQVAQLQPEDFDFDMKSVTLVDRKGRAREEARVYDLPLPPVALALAKQIVARMEAGEYRSNAKSLCDLVGKAMERCSLREATGNVRQARDVRSTITTWWADVEVDDNVSDFIQSHGLGGLVDKHYRSRDGGKHKKKIFAALQLLEHAITHGVLDEDEPLAA